ncbi:hypothetical protein BH24DEI2_BH24DEI2_25660 [soil metagenome]
MATIPDEQKRILQTLSADPEQNVLVENGPEQTWYLYEFTEQPPRITDVRQDVAAELLSYVERVAPGLQRKDLPDTYTVFTLTEQGKNVVDEA